MQTILTLSATQIEARQDELAEVLHNCVNQGASVSFMLPFEHQRAVAFWQKTSQSVARGERVVLACEDVDGQIVGTVQLITDQPENQPHRADVAKLLVHQRARRSGVASALMQALEQEAKQHGIRLLVLDTATGSGAETFYQHAGWQKAGEIPDYALMPDGALTPTSLFYKHLSA
ncbi:GNAT family N-acetyltransferase [Candidatus Pantoea multigeneris]|uniref:GNAT family N-acetyltransferase n=1 Tax=Candidatus Pantoea multigeneris TaxID=2608357 RepID=A0ABX0RF69_9GAMM|nr:GNAT family N-acetyltransferase [Pantoea multigeneris]NIF23697.1 GNAT family N-acetyltransferase [Pantoea multigeneris]